MKRTRKHWHILPLLVFGLLFALSAWKVGTTLFHAHQEDAAFAALAEEAAERRSAFAGDGQKGRFQSPYTFLKEQNPDFFGWLSIPGTRLDYPVVYTPDEPEYYIRRAFDGSPSQSGVPFVGEGWREDGGHTIIYGHNMKNGTMFAPLLSYADERFAREHPVICLDTLEESREFQVLGAFYSKAYPRAETDVFRYYQCIDLSEPEAFGDYVEQVRAASLYDTGVQAEYGGELLTLSTCSYHTGDGRFVVVAYAGPEEG